MDQKAIEADIKNYKIREGPLYKRSKFLKEWRERWIVLTTNFMYTFTNKNLDQVTDVIDLKDIKSYKSYLRKDQQMIPPGFKLRTGDDMYYFCAKNCNEKWTWLVSLQRLMDYKYVGASNYNNADWIKTKGFQSQIQFQNSKKNESNQDGKAKLDQQGKTSQQAKNQVNQQADSILKQLQQQQKELQKMKLELQKKESNIALQQKKIEEQRATQQAKNQQLKRHEQQIKAQQKKLHQKQQKISQQPQPKQQKKAVESPNKPQQKPQQSPSKTQKTVGQPSVSQIRSMFENRKSQAPTGPKPVMKIQQKKVQQKQDIHIFRSKVVSALFEEYRDQSFSNILKYVTDFLVNVCADQKCGYSPLVIVEGKTNANKKNFAQVFIQLLAVFNDYQHCQNLMKFIEICIFQMPGLFSPEQSNKTQNKLKDIFLKVDNQKILALVIKNMFIMHKIKKYAKNDIHAKLDKLVKQYKNEQTRNWALKLRDDL